MHLFHALQSGNKELIILLVVVPKIGVDLFASRMKIFYVFFLRLKGFEAYRHITLPLKVIYKMEGFSRLADLCDLGCESKH